jgi:predicted branched-subunit amino acid permease
MMEQIKRIKKPGVFIVSAFAALLGVFLFTGNISLLASLALALFLSVFVEQWENKKSGKHE